MLHLSLHCAQFQIREENAKFRIRKKILVCCVFIKIKNTLSELKSKINNDVVLIKINETIKQLDKIKPKVVKDNHIMAILLSYELIKEVKGQIV